MFADIIRSVNIWETTTKNNGNKENKFMDIILIIIRITNILICLKNITGRLACNGSVRRKRIVIDVSGDIFEFNITKGLSDQIITTYDSHLCI